MTEHADTEHIVSYKQLFSVLMTLFALTGVTVFASRFDFGALNVWIALMIASTKASLVLIFFMHLKNESNLIRGAFLVTVILLAVFIGLLILDVAYR